MSSSSRERLIRDFRKILIHYYVNRTTKGALIIGVLMLSICLGLYAGAYIATIAQPIDTVVPYITKVVVKATEGCGGGSGEWTGKSFNVHIEEGRLFETQVDGKSLSGWWDLHVWYANPDLTITVGSDWSVKKRETKELTLPNGTKVRVYIWHINTEVQVEAHHKQFHQRVSGAGTKFSYDYNWGWTVFGGKWGEMWVRTAPAQVKVTVYVTLEVKKGYENIYKFGKCWVENLVTEAKWTNIDSGDGDWKISQDGSKLEGRELSEDFRIEPVARALEPNAVGGEVNVEGATPTEDPLSASKLHGVTLVFSCELCPGYAINADIDLGGKDDQAYGHAWVRWTFTILIFALEKIEPAQVGGKPLDDPMFDEAGIMGTKSLLEKYWWLIVLIVIIIIVGLIIYAKTRMTARIARMVMPVMMPMFPFMPFMGFI